MDCSICAHIAGGHDFLFEDEHVVVEHLEPRDGGAYLGHLFVETRRHVAGHHTPHFHLHVIARHPGTPREYWWVRVDEWPDAPTGDAAQIAAFCARPHFHGP